MRRTRISHSKSRVGCRTCKKRKVKCDESKPFCTRCVSSNRICEGYGIVVDLPKRPPSHELASGESRPKILPKPAPVLKSVPHLDYGYIESHTFEFFRFQTVPTVAGIRSSNFWQNVVLPACYSEPAILHAAMTLANASQWNQSYRGKSTCAEGNAIRLGMIRGYNKAIHHLKAHTTASRIQQAMMHLNEGRQILYPFTLITPSPIDNVGKKVRAVTLSPNPQSVEDEIIGMFVDLDMQSTYFGFERPQLKLIIHKKIRSICPPLCPRPLSSFNLPAEFSSMQEANWYLNGTHFKTHIPIYTANISASLKCWRETYKQYCVKASDAEKSGRSWKRQSSLTLIHHAWLNICVGTSYFEVEETDFDAYLLDFTTIVDLASDALSEQQIHMNRFTLEFGMVAPLWWTTMKCRYPQIRCKALHLLGQAGREGLWDPYLLGQIARECIDIEWGIDKIDGGGLAEALSLHENVYSGQLVELRRRVSEATASDDYEENGVLVITFKRKLWTSNGDYAGNEEIIRRLPYETQ